MTIVRTLRTVLCALGVLLVATACDFSAVEQLGRAVKEGVAEEKEVDWETTDATTLTEDDLYDLSFKQLKEAGERGNTEAQEMVAYTYKNGYEGERSFEKAGKWFGMMAQSNDVEVAALGRTELKNMLKLIKLRNAAKAGDAQAQFEYGKAFDSDFDDEYGLDDDSDTAPHIASSWYMKAAEQGHADAQFIIGYEFEDGSGREQSISKAVEWYEKAAAQGHEQAQEGVERLGEFLEVEARAEAGDAEAQYELGNAHMDGVLRGIYFSGSYEEAFKWFAKASLQGHVKAQNSLAVMFAEGTGVEQSNKKAIKWYTKAARGGNPLASANLGWAFEHADLGLPKSYSKARVLYMQSAEGGDNWGQYYLAQLYVAGKGVPRSFEKAAQWFEKSAEQGNADAQLELGKLYAAGKGVPQDKAKSVHWFKKAARIEEEDYAGEPNDEAYYHLGKHYFEQGDKEQVREYLENAMSTEIPEVFTLLGRLRMAEIGKEGDEDAASDARSYFVIAATDLTGELEGETDKAAHYYLGVMARDGKGMEKDPVAAYGHFLLAGDSMPEAKEAMEALKLTEAQRTKARKISKKIEEGDYYEGSLWGEY